MVYLKILLFLVMLQGCSQQESTTYTSGVSLIPEKMENLGFELDISQDVVSAVDGLPSFNKNIKLSFNGKEVFIRSDLYDNWQFSFVYEVINNESNKANISFVKDNIKFELEFEFLSDSAGKWLLLDHSAMSGLSLSGSFNYTVITPPENHLYVGTVKPKETIFSTIINTTYPYRVYLPPEYEADDNTHFPVIYVTDAQWVFWSFSQHLDQQRIPVIMVAIEQGENNRREIDYLLPGSHDYIHFFKTEFMPLIEQTFRIDQTSRTIQGASYGGLVVSHFLFDHETQPAFNNYISSDGSYWHASEAYVELETLSQLNIDINTHATLYLSGASLDGNLTSVENYLARIESMMIANLTINFGRYQVTHVEIALPAFVDAVNTIFSR